MSELQEMLESHSLEDRLRAIRVLGDIGDAAALQVLRQRLDPVNQELTALVVAVGRLKRQLGVK